MDWQDNEFEGFLKRFRLRDPRPLPRTNGIGGFRSHRTKVAAAAVLVVAVGASAAIVRQYVTRAAKAEPPAVVQTVPQLVAKEPPAMESLALLVLPGQSSTPPSVKPDPRPREPLKELVKVMPPVEAQDAGPQANAELPAPSLIEFEENPGRRVFLDACRGCHAADLIAGSNSNFGSPGEYAPLVNRMTDRGAVVSPEQMPVLLDYLFKTFGRKQASSSDDRGKALVEAACTQCHGADVTGARKLADRETYRTIVMRMISYGASVPPDQMEILVDHLFRTYGPRP